MQLTQLEYHVCDACNLSCRFCAHYSNFHQSRRIESVSSAINEWLHWSNKITPNVFWILGGEPTLHPDLCELILAAKLIWKNSIIGLVTNGLKLRKHYGLNQVLVGCRLAISMHGIREDEIKNDVVAMDLSPTTLVEYREPDGWTSYYQFDDNGNPIPFTDGNQRQSWEKCNSNRCTVLRDNQLWKCPQVAFANSVGIDWFRGYSPCSIDDNIQSWLSREDETCCSNCPAQPQLTPHVEACRTKQWA